MLKKLVELTKSENDEIKIAACFTLKNLLFRPPKEVRTQVMKELTYQRLMLLLDDENTKV